MQADKELQIIWYFNTGIFLVCNVKGLLPLHYILVACHVSYTTQMSDSLMLIECFGREIFTNI